TSRGSWTAARCTGAAWSSGTAGNTGAATGSSWTARGSRTSGTTRAAGTGAATTRRSGRTWRTGTGGIAAGITAGRAWARHPRAARTSRTAGPTGVLVEGVTPDRHRDGRCREVSGWLGIDHTHGHGRRRQHAAFGWRQRREHARLAERVELGGCRLLARHGQHRLHRNQVAAASANHGR